MAHSSPVPQLQTLMDDEWEEENDEAETKKMKTKQDSVSVQSWKRRSTGGIPSSAVTPPPPPTGSREIHELWTTTLHSLYNEMKEIGKALTCSICQGTFHQPVLLPCVHTFCKDCLQTSLRGLRKCPVCLAKATPRSFMDAPFLEGVVHSYKGLLRSLGMTPIVYDDTVGMTQLPPSQDVDDDDDDDDVDIDNHHNTRNDNNDNVELSPHLRGKTPSLIECSTHLALSRLWQQAFLQEQQQLPPNSELERKKLSSLLQDQNRVVAVDERVLVRAAAVRHYARGGKPMATTTHKPASTAGAALKDDDEDMPRESTPPIDNTMMQVPPANTTDTPAAEQPMERKNENPPIEHAPLTTDDDDTAHHENATLSKPEEMFDAQVASKLSSTLKVGGHLTVSQQAHEECMEEARDQHTADRSNEVEDDDDDKTITVPVDTATMNTTSTFAFHDESAKIAATGSAASVSSGISWVTNTGKRNRKYGKAAVKPKPTIPQLDETLDEPDIMVQPPRHGDDNDDDNKLQRLPTHEPQVKAPAQENHEFDDKIVLPDPHVQGDDAIDRNEMDDDATTVAADPVNIEPSREPTTSGEAVAEDVGPSNVAACITLATSLSGTNGCDLRNSKFNVGDVVEVQPRTWSGINRPGGTARVTKVYDEDGSYFYDVVYVLGGRERKLDAIFVAPSEANDAVKTDQTQNINNNVAKAKKSRRLEEICIPPALLAQLSAEGFDTNGLGGRKGLSGHKRKEAPVKVKKEPRSDGKKRATTHREGTTKSKRSKSVGDQPISTNIKSRGHEKDAKMSATQAKENASSAKKGVKPAPKTTSKPLPQANEKKRPLQNKTTAASKRRKSSSTHAAVTNDPIGSRQTLQVLTDEDKCEQADAGYLEWFNDALQKSAVHVVASGLAEGDKTLLDALCKESKKRDVKVTLTDSFHPHKTTLCLVSVEKRDGANLISRSRTLKTMRAALAGIPIVDSSWIKACKEQKKVTAPKSELFVRSLPTKTADLNQVGARFGVAALAARVRQMKLEGISLPNAAHPLKGVLVFLCGSFKLPKKADIQVLLRESGCTIIPSTATAIAKLSTSTNEISTAIVLLCDDETSNDHCGISIGMAKATTEAIEKRKGCVIVVNTQWLFDCISCCDKLLPDFYPPHSTLAKRLWEKTISNKPESDCLKE